MYKAYFKSWHKWVTEFENNIQGYYSEILEGDVDFAEDTISINNEWKINPVYFSTINHNYQILSLIEK